VVAFDRDGLRVYRFGELAGPFGTRLGIPQFPGPDRERFWRALGGCIDPDAQPEATVPWGDVREIKAGNWVERLTSAPSASVLWRIRSACDARWSQ
jgi:hypothetical protein